MRTQLRPRPEITLMAGSDGDPQVAVLVTDAVSENALVKLRKAQRACRVVLVVSNFTEHEVFRAVGGGAAGFIPRSAATPEHLVHVIQTAARGDGYMPPDLLGALMKEVRSLQENVLIPGGRHFSGMSTREINVVRLIADGYDTAAIATKLAFSERTIKKVISGLLIRHGLSNRSHAVAYAMREGLI
ncbi:response regulator transcription factor [Streptomyces sp. NPDC001142]